MFEAACGYFLARGCAVIKMSAPSVNDERRTFRLPRRHVAVTRAALRVRPASAAAHLIVDQPPRPTDGAASCSAGGRK